MAYRLLSLTAISGEFPTDQLNRLPGSPDYLESVVTALKKDGLLRTDVYKRQAWWGPSLRTRFRYKEVLSLKKLKKFLFAAFTVAILSLSLIHI